MPFLAVDKDGTEFIFEQKPITSSKYKSWYPPYTDCSWMVLPKGSIKKLIGKKLKWEHEPYEMEE